MKNILPRPETRDLRENRHVLPLGVLFGLALLFWSRVLFLGDVLLPGEMLRGFLPFGGDLQKPWTILQWDALGQYYPWRHFAAQELLSGKIPLWNPYQFTGTPFLANAQSAVFYPLNFPFLVLDTARAFGVVAFLHTLLALSGTYFLCQKWGLSRAASVVSAAAFAFCGYLASWGLLPTLFATASWLPLALLLFERACEKPTTENPEAPRRAALALGFVLCLALLAGHAQIFFYVLLGLAIRQPFLTRKWRGIGILATASVFAACLGAAQILPTLELAGLSHRAQSGPPSAESWNFVRERALNIGDFAALVLPEWLSSWGTLSENFGYVGFGALFLAILGCFGSIFASKNWENVEFRAEKWFALSLAVFGLLYALATPLAQVFYFGIPGVSQMGGTGRALLLWSLGIALLCGFGVDFLRARIGAKNASFAALAALVLVCGELFFHAFSVQPTAPRETIYPRTTLLSWLQKQSGENNRVLFFTPKSQWLPSESFRAPQTHPTGVLPPNGATVYRIHDVNGYDSLALNQYRAWIASEEEDGVSPALNGNMVLLNNIESPVLDSLGVRYIVVPVAMSVGNRVGKLVFEADGCAVYQRNGAGDGGARVSGSAFAPGFRSGKYAPETFRFGVFVSLCALSFGIASGIFEGIARCSGA